MVPAGKIVTQLLHAAIADVDVNDGRIVWRWLQCTAQQKQTVGGLKIPGAEYAGNQGEQERSEKK